MIHRVTTDGNTRELQAVAPRPSLAVGLGLLIGAVLLGYVLAGHGGSADGAIGTATALVVLCGGAYMIQRLFRSRVAVGFDRDGVYVPSAGWIPWYRVRQMQVRRLGNVITGRRTVIWLAYHPAEPGAEEVTGGEAGGGKATREGGSAEEDRAEDRTVAAGPEDAIPEPAGPEPAGPEPAGPEGAGGVYAEPTWLVIRPKLSERRTLELSEVLERCWASATATAPAAGGAVSATAHEQPAASPSI